MELGYVIAYVQDVSATVKFYEAAFGLATRFASETGEYAELETGATALAFASEAMEPTHGELHLNRIESKPGAVEIALVVSDVDAAFAKAVAAGAAPILDPVRKPWGQTVSYVRDNNGVLVEICSPVGS